MSIDFLEVAKQLATKAKPNQELWRCVSANALIDIGESLRVLSNRGDMVSCEYCNFVFKPTREQSVYTCRNCEGEKVRVKCDTCNRIFDAQKINFPADTVWNNHRFKCDTCDIFGNK